jgi:hypothetical protein
MPSGERNAASQLPLPQHPSSPELAPSVANVSARDAHFVEHRFGRGCLNVLLGLRPLSAPVDNAMLPPLVTTRWRHRPNRVVLTPHEGIDTRVVPSARHVVSSPTR